MVSKGFLDFHGSQNQTRYEIRRRVGGCRGENIACLKKKTASMSVPADDGHLQAFRRLLGERDGRPLEFRN